MKSKTIKQYKYLPFLAALFFMIPFGLYANNQAYADSCSVTANWYVVNGDGTNSLISGSVTVDTTKTYLAVANFTGCQNLAQPSINVAGINSSGSFFGQQGGIVASSITTSPEQHNVTVTFSQSANYSFTVTVGPVGGSSYQSFTGPTINVTVPGTASAANASSLTCTTDANCTSAGTGPNGWNYICNQGKCVEDINLPAGSHCVPNQSVGDDCAGNAFCDPTTSTCVVNEYGCQAGGTSAGVWTCSPDQSLQSTCGSSFGPVSPAAKCGCTDAAYSAGTCNNGKTQGSGAGTPPAGTTAAGGQAANSATTLINPIPTYNNLTALVVGILKGFLGIIAVWAVAFIVIGGFKMVVSAGNEEAVLSARKTITWAVLGLLVAVLSFAIVAIVQDFIGVNVQPTTTTTTTTTTN
jgi:hypothetical protein